MDLSKAFDTINQDLLLSKLKAYGFNEKSVSFVGGYLTNRYQQTKIGSAFKDWNEIITLLRIIFEDYTSSFSDSVTILNKKTIQQRCINLTNGGLTRNDLYDSTNLNV